MTRDDQDGVIVVAELERLRSKQELADMCGVSKETVNTWLKRGAAPPSLKVGRHRRWRDADIEVWLKQCRSGGERSA